MTKAERKAKSRQAIIASAGDLLRERGIGASSVADVMKGAGLTVGGFYGHFDSKEALFAAAIESQASALWDRLIASTEGGTRAERIRGITRRYLSRKHRDGPGDGCILPNVVGEVAREGGPYRRVLAAKLEDFLQGLTRAVGRGASGRQEAIGLLALMYGALALSRAVQGEPLSDELLRSGRKAAARIAGTES